MLSARDRKLIWHPFTQHKGAMDVMPISRGKGAYVYDTQDKAYLDLISSWWVNIHGHAHPVIAQRIYEQACQLEHIIFAGFTHEPAVQLCEKLSEVLPLELSRFFFSDNGSTATEVALKMAYQFWQQQGAPERRQFLSFQGGYHGDTLGAMSLGMGSGFHTPFTELCFQVHLLPYPFTWKGDSHLEQKEQHALQALDILLSEKGQHIAALIVEPMIQGASGMRIVRPEFLNAYIQKVRAYGILVIFDEVMTGFGRTGKYFALEHTHIVPDFLCLSKALTGGFLPLALTVVQPKIYEAFLHEEWRYAFAHGHSYTANPLACAAALTSLELLRDASCWERIQAIESGQKHALEKLEDQCPWIEKPRCLGTISAFDVPEGYPIQALHQACVAQGLLIRPLSRTVYFLPPYVMTSQELSDAIHRCGHIASQIHATES
jgi:adenosylmethionine-8-amino-7-oxononanoate aminotransferase